MSEVAVRIDELGQDEEGREVVILRDDHQRGLRIWIGPCEAAAIWMRVGDQRMRPPVRRPMTHDLLGSLLERLGARLERVVIDDLWNNTFYAKLHVAVGGERLAIDARPSDALALAVRTDSPILVADWIMKAAGQGEETP